MTAFVNLDMISRGGAADVVGGGTTYLQSIGSRRRSTQLGGIADSVASAHRFQLDYAYDAAGHEERVYCRSDHWNFARFGVPVVFFTTGGHEDYHRVTDEVDRSDFEKLARVTTFTAGVVQAIASRPEGLVRNLPAPDPNAACQQ
jgi:Zn-dependent M28 family amino/carboxypeptidase